MGHLDRTNTSILMREKFNHWIQALEQRSEFGLNLRQDVETAVDSYSDPDAVSIQDIFKTMAKQAKQQWSLDADPLVDKDVERAQKLYLKAPQIKNRVDRLKVGARLIHSWDEVL